MDKSVLEKKWFCKKGSKDSDFWNISAKDTYSYSWIGVTYGDIGGICAKQIVKDHNEQLKVKKALPMRCQNPDKKVWKEVKDDSASKDV